MIIKGIDTVEFGIEVLDYFKTTKNMLEVFSSLKNRAHEEGKEFETELNGVNLKVHRTGAAFYSYRLTCNDFSILFMDKEVKNNPPIKVRFLSSYLWSAGFSKAVRDFLTWLDELGLSIITTKLSRIDICIDSDETPFFKADLDRIVTRARGKTNHFVNDEFYNGVVFSGFTIGRGNLMARIYDKTLEVKKSQKVWFYDLWKEYSWNQQTTVWRVEFQIRRKCLSEFGISTIEDFLTKENNIWSYLTNQWLTLKIPSSDKNKTRWPIDPRWTIVQNADLNQTYLPAIRKKVKLGNTEQLLNQIAGLLITVGSLNDHSNLDITAELAKRWTENRLQKKNITFEQEKVQRHKRFIPKHLC